MQEYISIEPLPLCSAINEVKHVLCIGYSIYTYAIYAGLCGGSLTVQADGALQGTGPL